MIDFHTHILPKMDDGSSSSDMSCAMLDELYAQRAGIVIATSHFYAYENSPSRYLARRQASFEALLRKRPNKKPSIRLGAEVQYFEGMTLNADLPSLCIEGTDLLLVEMPFMPWSDRVIDDITELNRRPDLRILLAHVDRYPEHRDTGLMSFLKAEGIAIQVNAEAFLSWRTRRDALRLFENGTADVLGSDCHNMTSRRPNLEDARDVIEKKLGTSTIRRINKTGRGLLGLPERKEGNTSK